MNPLVTVAIPSRNRPHLLATTLRSVLAQRAVAVDVVVVDDGSDPREAAATASLAGGAVRVLRNEVAGGVARARNQGAQAGRGTWVAFLDDDDLWVPQKLTEQVTLIEVSDRAWVYSGAVKFATGPVARQVMHPPAPDTVRDLLPQKNVVPAGASNVLAHRSTFLDLGGFDRALSHLADWDMWLRLLEHGPPAAVPGLAVAYRQHPQAMSMDPQGVLAELAVLDRRWRHLRSGDPLHWGPTHLWIARSHLRAGRRMPAVSAFWKASWTMPSGGMRDLARGLFPGLSHRARAALAREGVAGLHTAVELDLPAEMTALLQELGGPVEPGAVARG